MPKRARALLPKNVSRSGRVNNRNLMKNIPCPSYPCIIGVAQKTWRPSEGDAPHPLLQCAEVTQAAAEDCGNKNILQYIDEVDAVLSISWHYDNLAQQLGEHLQLKAGERKISGLSGTHPQRFINEAAEHIMHGKRRAVLVTGAEAFATKKRAKKDNRTLDWPKAQSKPGHVLEDPYIPTEISHEVFQAYTTFALLDSARRAKLGLTLEENRRQQAQMMAHLSTVAAQNPHAWFPKAYTAEQLFETRDGNRMVSSPYSKNVMAFMDVDMAASLIIASDELADELGVPQEKRIYLRGWGYDKEHPYIAQRSELWHSAAMARASAQALHMAKLSIDDIKHLDIYSCFPSSLNFSRDALALGDNLKRPLTVTGGLPYFGGPGNNYTTHSIASMVDTLRQHHGEHGLISGVGMHMTHHVFAVYSSIPAEPMPTLPAAHLPAIKKLQDHAHGPAIILGYTVNYSPLANTALAVCELPNGDRCYARCTDPDILKQMDAEEWVGKTVHLISENNINRIC
jgi:acetyl-CoA C-acetyltransferase